MVLVARACRQGGLRRSTDPLFRRAGLNLGPRVGPYSPSGRVPGASAVRLAWRGLPADTDSHAGHLRKAAKAGVSGRSGDRGQHRMRCEILQRQNFHPPATLYSSAEVRRGWRRNKSNRHGADIEERIP